MRSRPVHNPTRLATYSRACVRHPDRLAAGAQALAQKCFVLASGRLISRRFNGIVIVRWLVYLEDVQGRGCQRLFCMLVCFPPFECRGR